MAKVTSPPETITQTPTVTAGATSVDSNVKPLPNSFDKFASMTYSLSLYLQSVSHLNNMVKTSVKDVKGLSLLIQTGGIVDNSKVANGGATRNTYFKNDYYLDNLQLTGSVSGTVTGSATNIFDIKFTVTEPMGLTFLPNLNSAIRDFNKNDEDFNFLNQYYLMVIRFYGYDKDGNQISASELSAKNSDSKAYSEKWIPFQIKNIGFTMSDEQITYSVEGIPSLSYSGNDQIHGTVPFNIGLQGQTIDHMLSGRSTNYNHKESGVVVKGLMAALNDWQADQVHKGLQGVADTYEIEIDPEIANAKLIDRNSTTLMNRTGMFDGLDQKAWIKNVSDIDSTKVLKNTRTLQINAGMKIMQFIDLAIRTSSYISSQYNMVKDVNKDNTTKIVPVKNNGDPLKWFKIRCVVTPQEHGKYDCIRNMYPVNVKYVVSKYKAPSANIDSLDSLACFYPVKEYDYWFTGKNTQVLSFKQEYSALYYTTFSNKEALDASLYNPSKQFNRRTMRAYRVNSTQDNQGGKENLQAELGANAATQLYSPADQGRASIDIIGDPDWIVQSQLFYPAAVADAGTRVMPDGSVNYDSAEIYFSINYNTVVDYADYVGSGLADVTEHNLPDPQAQNQTVSQYSFTYRANIITSEFNQGQFSQRLDGTIAFIPEECITGKPSAAEKVTATQEKAQLGGQGKKSLGPKQSQTSTTAKTTGKGARPSVTDLCKGKANTAAGAGATTENTAAQSKGTRQ